MVNGLFTTLGEWWGVDFPEVSRPAFLTAVRTEERPGAMTATANAACAMTTALPALRATLAIPGLVSGNPYEQAFL